MYIKSALYLGFAEWKDVLQDYGKIIANPHMEVVFQSSVSMHVKTVEKTSN